MMRKNVEVMAGGVKRLNCINFGNKGIKNL